MNIQNSESAAGMPEFVTADQLAPTLGVSKARLYQLVRDQIVPAVHVGRSIKFDLPQIREWIEGGGSSLPGGWRKEPVE
jgi:excisionase family DNA binding protein